VNNRRGLPLGCRYRRFRSPLPCLFAAVAVAFAVAVAVAVVSLSLPFAVHKPAPYRGFGVNLIIVPFPFCRSAVFLPFLRRFVVVVVSERVKDKSYRGGRARWQPKPPPKPPQAAAARRFLCLFRRRLWRCAWALWASWCGWWDCRAVAVCRR